MFPPATASSSATRRIVVADVLGFCFGVRRAVEIAENARGKRIGAITMLGPIVHNDQVIAQLAERGIGTASDIGAIDGGAVVLSAHGVSPTVVKQSRRRHLDIIDVTCPFVTRLHQRALQLSREGRHVVLVGDARHTEVRGAVGAVTADGGSITVVAGAAEMDGVEMGDRVGVVSQTTQYSDVFDAVVAAARRVANDVRAYNTICGATQALQDAARRMARCVDVAIVVGGPTSANTCRLRELCAAQGIPAYQVATAGEIDDAWIEGMGVIGITAGASTPDWTIEEVARRLSGGRLPVDWALLHPEKRRTAAPATAA